MTVYDSLRYAMANRWDPRHLERIDRLADFTGEQALEIGCGSGRLLKRLAGRGIDIIGIDANPNAAEMAETSRVRTMMAESLEFEDEAFDSIVSVHAIEHIPPLDDALAEAERVLKPVAGHSSSSRPNRSGGSTRSLLL